MASACHYLSYTVQKFEVSLVKNTWYVISYQKFDIYMRFRWSMKHGMLLTFLYRSEIWHLHETSMVNNTWYANKFSLVFGNLTFTVHPRLSESRLSNTSIIRTPKVTVLLEYFSSGVCSIRVNDYWSIWRKSCI